ncbi:alpha/beta fold hydrolase [Roseateles depolymerans]|uniref:Alpha/beta hydrolase family protein n=1 Tax=Roseateles depolymerans TaxID=76731 RepID=A0A0U3M9D5_9BURK|nr:alpha/beta hydrolase [Roseateles depolymerans]ALV05197.1 Alpha/beta hydrolase family protein [Roseateles depolymerans]REG14787.1 pimeloyl-ACP methyl ester carboxylesterase [Roseateles depolymerans]
MFIQSNGIRVHVKQAGDGDRTLVFLHYYGGSSRTWQRVIDTLSSQFRTVATDHRGWGQSEAPQEGYRIEDMANDAQGVIEALGLQRYVLVGHSMGGKTAQLLASRQLPGLEGVVLVAPSPPSPMRLSEQERTVMAGAYDTPASVEWVVDHVLTATPLAPELKAQVIEDSLAGSAQAKRAWPEVGMAEDITAAVGHIRVPVLVLSGDGDKVDRTDTLREELLPRIPGARLQVLAGPGHLLPLEAPKQVAAAIEGFVRELDARGQRSERKETDAARSS